MHSKINAVCVCSTTETEQRICYAMYKAARAFRNSISISTYIQLGGSLSLSLAEAARSHTSGKLNGINCYILCYYVVYVMLFRCVSLTSPFPFHLARFCVNESI